MRVKVKVLVCVSFLLVDGGGQDAIMVVNDLSVHAERVTSLLLPPPHA